MAKKPPLLECPNFSTCSTYVPANKRGQEHVYYVWNSAEQKMDKKTCPGG